MEIELKESEVVVLLGGNILNSGVVDYCHRHGFVVVVVDWSPDAALKGDYFMCVDVKDSDTIIQRLEALDIKHIAGAFTSIDLAVASVNAIHRHYGLCAMEKNVSDNALSKGNMTKIWAQHGLLNRYSAVFTDWDEGIREMNKQTKLIVKPNISSSSRGIAIIPVNDDRTSILSAFEKAKNESFDHNVIVEEFVDGREFTCEMLGDAYGNVSVYAISVKYHTANTSNNKIAVKLHYNSDVYPNRVYKRIAMVGKQCYKALGLTSSFGHLEILMKSDGTLSPVEIGARSSGFIAAPLVSLASGRDFFGDYLRVLHGENVSGQDYINGAKSSMYFFYDMPHGTQCMNSCSLMNFLPDGIESKYANRDKVMTKGFLYNDISNDNERIGYEIITGARHLMSIANIEDAEQKFINQNTGRGIL